jgi:hypothetical protein
MTLGAQMTPPVIRMTIESDATTWSVAYVDHSVNRNMFIVQATVACTAKIF